MCAARPPQCAQPQGRLRAARVNIPHPLGSSGRGLPNPGQGRLPPGLRFQPRGCCAGRAGLAEANRGPFDGRTRHCAAERAVPGAPCQRHCRGSMALGSHSPTRSGPASGLRHRSLSTMAFRVFCLSTPPERGEKGGTSRGSVGG